MMRRKLRVLSSRLNYQDIPLVDYVLGITVLCLTLFGILMVYDTSVVVAFEQFGDKLWFLKNQTMWASIGIVAGLVVSGLNYQIWRKFAPLLFVVSIVMLVLVYVPGFSAEVYGARQRLVLPGGLPFLQNIFVQPSELVKLTLVIYLASLFSRVEGKKKLPQVPHVHFFIVTGLVAMLIAMEPDLGNAVLVSITAFMIYVAAGASFLGVGLLTLVGVMAALLYAVSSDYRRARLTTFLNPLNDPQNTSYQITQILIALGSGGIFGLGLGNSRQKYQYIPEVTTDSIFAIIGEELGFVGATLVIGVLFFVVWRGFSIAVQTEDRFGKLLATGITTNIAVQAIVNLGGMLQLMPLTGVPLPFISYGGSSLTLLLVSVGILLNISRTKSTVRNMQSGLA